MEGEVEARSQSTTEPSLSLLRPEYVLFVPLKEAEGERFVSHSET